MSNEDREDSKVKVADRASDTASSKRAESLWYLRSLVRNEESDSHYPCVDYLQVIERRIGSNAVCSSSRRKICDWFFAVVDHNEFDRKIAFLALSYLDHISAANIQASADAIITNREYQLLATTALYLAIKTHVFQDKENENESRLMSHVLTISRGFFKGEDIKAQEFEMIQSLNASLNAPSYLCFIYGFLCCCPKWLPSNEVCAAILRFTGRISCYAAFLAAGESSFCISTKVSVASYALILLAMNKLPSDYVVPHEVQESMGEAVGLCPSSTEVREAYAKLDQVSAALNDFVDDMFNTVSSSIESHNMIENYSYNTDEHVDESGNDARTGDTTPHGGRSGSIRKRKRKDCSPSNRAGGRRKLYPTE